MKSKLFCLKKKAYRIVICLLVISNSLFAQHWTGSPDINGNVYRNGGIGINSSNFLGHISFGEMGNHLTIPRPGFASQVVLATGWTGANGDFTDLRVPGAVVNNALIRLQANGFVGFGPSVLYEKFQLSSRFLFHDGGAKKISYNGYYDPNQGVIKRVDNAPVTEISFNSDGTMHFLAAPSGSAQSVVDNAKVGIYMANNAYVGIGRINPQSQLHVAGSALIETDNDEVLTFNNNDNSWQYMQFKRSNVRQVWMGLNSVSDFNIVKEAQGNIVLESVNGNVVLSPTAGNVGIGTTDTKGYRLAVKGDAIFTKVKVTAYNNWPDYVFHSGYCLRPLSEVEQYIQKYQHLPEVPSAEEVKKEGFDMGDNQAVLLKKIEELTLYLIEQNKQIKVLTEQNKKLEQRVSDIETLKSK